MVPETAQAQRIPGSSIELTRNAKGDYQWAIKIYFDAETHIEGDEATENEPMLGEAAEALRMIGRIDTELRGRYLPGAVGFDGVAVDGAGRKVPVAEPQRA